MAMMATTGKRMVWQWQGNGETVGEMFEQGNYRYAMAMKATTGQNLKCNGDGNDTATAGEQW